MILSILNINYMVVSHNVSILVDHVTLLIKVHQIYSEVNHLQTIQLYSKHKESYKL